MPVPRQMRVEGNPHSLTRKSERVCCQVAGGGLDRLTGQPGSPELLELRAEHMEEQLVPTCVISRSLRIGRPCAGSVGLDQQAC